MHSDRLGIKRLFLAMMPLCCGVLIYGRGELSSLSSFWKFFLMRPLIAGESGGQLQWCDVGGLC